MDGQDAPGSMQADRERCRKNIEMLRNDLDNQPQFVNEGLMSFESETMEERIARRRRVAELLMKRDAPFLNDPLAEPPPDEGQSSGSATVSHENQPVVDPKVLAFPEQCPPGFVNEEVGLRDPNHEGPELVSLAGLAALEREGLDRPVSYFDIFKEEPKKPQSMEPWSHLVDTSELDEFHRRHRSNPLRSREPLDESYLRGVHQVYRRQDYRYEENPGYDPMFGESDPNLPSLEEALKRDRAHRMQPPVSQANGQNAGVHGDMLLPPAHGVQKQPTPMASVAAPLTPGIENSAPNFAASSSATTTKPSTPKKRPSTPKKKLSSTPTKKFLATPKKKPSTPKKKPSTPKKKPSTPKKKPSSTTTTKPSSTPKKKSSSKSPTVPPSHDRPFRCPACSRTYKYKHKLKEHMKKLHQEVPPATIEKWLQILGPGLGKQTATVPFVKKPEQPLSIEDQSARLPAVPPPVVPTVTPELAQQQHQPIPKEIDTSNEPMKSQQPSKDHQPEKHKPAETPKAPPVGRFRCNRCPASFHCPFKWKEHTMSKHLDEDQQQVTPVGENGPVYVGKSDLQSATVPQVPQSNAQMVNHQPGQAMQMQHQTPSVEQQQQMISDGPAAVMRPNSQVVNHQNQPGQAMSRHRQTQPVQQPQQPIQLNDQGQNSGQGNNGNVMMAQYNAPQPTATSNQPTLLQNGQYDHFASGANQVYRQQPATHQYAQNVPSQRMYMLQSNGQGVPASRNGPRLHEISTVYVHSSDGTMRPIPASDLGQSSTQSSVVYNGVTNNESDEYDLPIPHSPRLQPLGRYLQRQAMLRTEMPMGHQGMLRAEVPMPHQGMLRAEVPVAHQARGSYSRQLPPEIMRIVHSSMWIQARNNQIRPAVQPQGGLNAANRMPVPRNDNPPSGPILRLPPGGRVIGNIHHNRFNHPYFIPNRQNGIPIPGPPQVRPALPNLPDHQVLESRQQLNDAQPMQPSPQMPSSSHSDTVKPSEKNLD